MEEKVLDGLTYLTFYPKDFRKDEKYPVIFFLHGAGGRNGSAERLLNASNVQHLLSHQDKKGYILIAPICPRGDWNEWMSHLVHLVETYREASYIDNTRVYLTGNSMGGYGTWALATLYPDWFAAVMPICGGGIGGFAKNLVNLPIRTFHGLRDKTVDPIESLQMAKAVNVAGGHAELILFPELAHRCWDAVYSDEKNFDWLLSFTTRKDETEFEDLSGENYG